MRQALRAATAGLHARVDQAMPLAQPAPTLAHYRDHLRILARWLDDLAALPISAARLAAERDAIEHDLRECARLLGPDPAPAPAPGPARTAAAREAPPSPAFGWGARYVLEGSRLGGKVMHKTLGASLAPHSLAYLSGAGWVAEGAWREFLGELQRQLKSPAELAAACEGARTAFSMLLARCAGPTDAPA